MKAEYKIILELLEENSRILDVGCDDGTLMQFLIKLNLLFNSINFKADLDL